MFLLFVIFMVLRLGEIITEIVAVAALWSAYALSTA
jgi:hypothetical protein